MSRPLNTVIDGKVVESERVSEVAAFVCAKAAIPILVAPDAKICPHCGGPLPERRIVEELGR